MRPLRFLLLFCFLLLPADAYAQRAADGLNVGLRVGGSLATFHGNTGAITRGGEVDYEGRRGFHIAGFVSFPLTDVLALRPELTYVQKGASVDDVRPFGTSPDGPVTVEEDYKFSYLQVPVLLEIRIPTGNALTSYLLLGPSIGTNLGATIDRNEQVVTEAIPESEVHTFEVGFTTGGELGYSITPTGTLLLGAHYDIGLNQVIGDDRAAARKGKEAEFRNGALTLSLGYRLSF